MADRGYGSDLKYCAELVRQSDPDRFATAMLAAMPERGRLLALYAFNLEIARTRESVSEAMLGEIRLQWWRDVIAGCAAGKARRHQVVQPLARSMADAELPANVLSEAVDA